MMRVLSILSLLCLSVLGVSSQYVSDGANTDTSKWRFSAPAAVVGIDNPSLTFTAGNTYTFDVSATPGHPFNFSSTNSGTSVTALDSTFYTVTGSAGCTGSANKGFAGPTNCIVTLVIKANAPATTLYYQCTFHPAMTKSITVLAAGPTTGGTITSNAFHITGSVGISAYVFTHNGVQYANPTLQVPGGSSVTFSLELNSTSHPFGLSQNTANPVQLSQDFFPNSLNDATNGYTANGACDVTTSNLVRVVTINTTTWSANNPCVITVQTPKTGGTLYYRCGIHSPMIGTINVTPKNAATVASAGLAIVIAIIATIMA